MVWKVGLEPRSTGFPHRLGHTLLTDGFVLLSYYFIPVCSSLAPSSLNSSEQSWSPLCNLRTRLLICATVALLRVCVGGGCLRACGFCVCAFTGHWEWCWLCVLARREKVKGGFGYLLLRNGFLGWVCRCGRRQGGAERLTTVHKYHQKQRPVISVPSASCTNAFPTPKRRSIGFSSVFSFYVYGSTAYYPSPSLFSSFCFIANYFVWLSQTTTRIIQLPAPTKALKDVCVPGRRNA